MKSSTLALKPRRLLLTRTLKALEGNQGIIVRGSSAPVRCPLSAEEDHVCYVARASESLGSHPGEWARDFMLDLMPQETMYIENGESEEWALGRMLDFEDPEDMVLILQKVGDFGEITRAIQGLCGVETQQVTKQQVRDIFGI